MAKVLTANQSVHGYTIDRQLNNGAMAISYAARSAAGEKVFFKQYKSPTPTVPWFRGYVEYQAELKRRIEGGPSKGFTYRFIDFFATEEGAKAYYQVFEFVEHGNNLRDLLEGAGNGGRPLAWEQRLLLAQVMMAGIETLHRSRIVHSDLKPENIQLFRDEKIKAGYRLKIIDMDFSILDDRKAPWDGSEGYVGTPGYLSPEHLQGKVPEPRSDVFTCGLMLYELLAQGHPYLFEEASEYQTAIMANTAPPPRLLGRMPTGVAETTVVQIMQACLAPDPSNRPTAEQVLGVLNGRYARWIPEAQQSGTWKCPDCGYGENPVDRSTCGACSYIRFPAVLQLVEEVSGRVIKMRLDTSVGRTLLKGLVDDDARLAGEPQYSIFKSQELRSWAVQHNSESKNPTYLNAAAMGVGPTALKSGDALSIGPIRAKVIVKLEES